MKRIVYFISLLFLFVSCQKEQTEDSLVVEGWIEANGYPTVLIHKSYVFPEKDYSTQTFYDIAQDQLIAFGRVTVGNGTDEVVLTGRIDTTYMPPYLYNTINIKGQVGQTYTVTAKYRDHYATATTTIPPVARFDSMLIRTSSDKTKRLVGYIGDDGQEPRYYLVFARKMRGKQFIMCNLGAFDNSKVQDGKIEIYINNPLKDTREEDFLHSESFFTDSVYQIKLSRIDNESYNYWKAFALQDQTQGVLFVPVYKNIQGNVQGGIGNFTGMGSSVYTLHFTNDTVLTFP